MNGGDALVLVALLLGTVAFVAELRRRALPRPAGRRFFRHPGAELALGLLIVATALAVLAPLVAAYGPAVQIDVIGLKNQPPSWAHPLGTDLFGRDVWSRLVYAGRVSLGVGALATAVAVTIGTAVGAVAGYFRRWADAVLMRVVDVGLAVPRIFLVLLAVALWDRLPLSAFVLALGATGWFATSRLVRAEVLALRERPFVDAARALGARPARVLWRHILPNAAAPVIISAALGVGNVMLVEAGLSFLGVGVQPPVASWGNMIADAEGQLAVAPWTSVFPGIAIAVAVLSCNALADALRDAWDPRAEAA